MFDSWSPGLLLTLGTSSEAHTERRNWRKVGGEKDRAIITVGRWAVSVGRDHLAPTVGGGQGLASRVSGSWSRVLLKIVYVSGDKTLSTGIR